MAASRPFHSLSQQYTPKWGVVSHAHPFCCNWVQCYTCSRSVIRERQIFESGEKMSLEPKWLENGTITSPRGYQAGATYSGIRTYAEDKLDLGVVRSEVPCNVAGTFTTNN